MSGIIIGGGGVLGTRCVRELRRLTSEPITVIEQSEARAEMLRSEFDSVTVIEGDALEDATLEAAGVRSARALVATLGTERDNLFLVLSVRQLSTRCRIVARLIDSDNATKFARVGADEVVREATMGGQRMAHAILHPALAELTDALTASENRTVHMRELVVAPHSPIGGMRIAAAGILERTGCMVLGHRRKGATTYRYHPDPRLRLKPGSGVIALGDTRQLQTLESLLAGNDATH